ncbi:exodeoxyribonuclease V subunit gamma [Vibrio gallicus]|uniref:exodeoxyribonuclease V subunit gamma n=1 Tax=Vibrio gallicus TaxID=190897 RepID=UPI0021C477A0|nr:exodeoxyribonuclease V subunit gamma [Vibrio gallicus]
MFTVYHSNQIDVLKSLLIALMGQKPLSSPFEQEQILVQSPGMSQWLKMAIAEDEGIAANINFPLPATFIWNMFVEILPDVPKRSTFNKEAMTWKLMHILPTLLKGKNFSPLAQYLEQDNDGSKCYQLCEKIADIFDGYLVYRADYILSWEQGLHPLELGEQGLWQGELWRALVDYTQSLNQSPYHRANLYQSFIDALSRGELVEHEGLPKRLFVFGISSLPPKYLEALKALGEHIDVHLLFHNPCRFYWGDVKDQKTLIKMSKQNRPKIRWHGQDWLQEQGEVLLKGDIESNQLPESNHLAVSNNLLASLGKQGRDNLHLLSLLESNEIDAFADVDSISLLTQIQQDMLLLEQHQDDSNLLDSHHKQVVPQHDNSLTLHACHSATREVEVLYDQLLHLFNSDPNLKPKDIIVMVSDINTYAPIIQSIFGNTPYERRIPFSISDRSASQESPILNAFMQLLNLPNSRCERGEILSLLETPAILQRFAISESEFDLLSNWIEEAGIRWGLDSQTSLELELPEMSQNTWLFGLRRILMGYAMSSDTSFDIAQQAVAPYQQVEGLQAELAGKLAHFVETLLQHRGELAKARTADLWQQQVIQMLEAFFILDVDNELAIKTIRDAISQLVGQTEEAQFSQLIDLRIVSEYLQGKLDTSRISQRFLAGQVNFCTLMPMRSIPFKVVCLLGMNDGAYPRTVAKEGFDLINVKARSGDRSRRDDDRYLFLEAILSAQQKLYISYVGQSIHDNSPRLPSIVVTELMEFCSQNYCLDVDTQLSVDMSGQQLLDSISFKHSMTPFSLDAFSEHRGSFASEWAAVANMDISLPLSADHSINPNLPTEIDIEELIRFWSLPVKYFFNRQLNIWFEGQGESIEDNEPFSLNGLESYLFKQQLLEAELDQGVLGTDKLADWLHISGQLPIGYFGTAELEEVEAVAREIAKEVQFVTASAQVDIQVSLPLNQDTQLVGWLKQRYAAGGVYYRAGRVRSQDIFSTWIQHLIASISSKPTKTHFIGFDKHSGVQHYYFEALDTDVAQSLFDDLTSEFLAGQKVPLPYFPVSAFEAMSEFNKRLVKMDSEQARALARSKFESVLVGNNYSNGEYDNYYIQRVWKELDSNFYSKAMQLSERILLPAIERLKLMD